MALKKTQIHHHIFNSQKVCSIENLASLQFDFHMYVSDKGEALLNQVKLNLMLLAARNNRAMNTEKMQT